MTLIYNPNQTKVKANLYTVYQGRRSNGHYQAHYLPVSQLIMKTPERHDKVNVQLSRSLTYETNNHLTVNFAVGNEHKTSNYVMFINRGPLMCYMRPSPATLSI